MLVHLRRSLVMAVICLVFFGFVYALAGTGVAQGLFKNQADGSIRPNGSTLIGQNWSSPKWFHGRPDDTGPYAADPKATPPVAGGDNPLVANGNRGESGASNLGPHSKVLLTNTQALVAYWHISASTRLPTWSPRRGVVTTPTSPRTMPWSRSPWSPRPPASPRQSSGH